MESAYPSVRKPALEPQEPVKFEFARDTCASGAIRTLIADDHVLCVRALLRRSNPKEILFWWRKPAMGERR